MSHLYNRSNRIHVLAAATALALASPLASAQTVPPHKVESINVDTGIESIAGFDRFIVKYRANSPESRNPASMRRALERAAVSTNQLIQASRLQSGGKAKAGKPLGLAHVRRMAIGSDVVSTSSKLDRAGALTLMRQLAANPNVQSVEIDAMMKPVFTPNDSFYANNQWHYFEAVGGIRADLAWDKTRGAGAVVAVIDTGITNHTDLNANLLPGYDFVSHAGGNDATPGRDSDNSDPGDWVPANACFAGSLASNSSWHGTHVAGTVAAVTNNATGVAGVAHHAKVVPVRVLGQCGGSISDIADAIVWASGGTVAGVPANANPAHVINMSLGGSGLCGATYQAAINAAVARGTTVVISAGNGNTDVGTARPANCDNVIAVAASTRTATRSTFSNTGPRIDIAAPGTTIASTLNTGLTVPLAQAYANYNGTSMAAPHVAGVAALIQAYSPVPRTPAQVELMIKGSVRDVPVFATFTSKYIGRGILDANAALGQAKPCTGLIGDPLKACRIICESTTTTGQRDLFIKMWISGMGTTPVPCDAGTGGFYQNTVDVAIPDGTGTSSGIPGANAESSIVVAGRVGNASSRLAVNVVINHTWVQDLRVDLVAPDGTVYNLVNRAGGSSDNFDQIFVVNASSEAANGTWKLRANDDFAIDTGMIDKWSLQY